MLASDSLIIKIASQPNEYEQIHILNYQTFADEIPQHQHDESKKLVDKYHEENIYVICVLNKEVVGMIALRDIRPLSLDEKLENIESYLPPFKRILEYRLLAVKKQHRNSAIFSGIMKKAYFLAIEGGYDIAVISGTTNQTKLYKHLGFTAFGPLVGKPGAFYQPMYIDVKGANELKKQSQVLKTNKANEKEKLLYNYLPGPVSIAKGVMSANCAPPQTHRSLQFIDDFNDLRKMLCERVNAQQVQIMTGSGTLANDIVAAQLSTIPGKGLVLVNGEFGRRIQNHAVRAGLEFDLIEVQEGETFSPEVLKDKINTTDRLKWIWMVHCETSTGVLNDINMLRQLTMNNVKLCIDGISSIGACEVDLKDVYLATTVSGKGIGSLSGLAMVFGQKDALSSDSLLPCYFDLAYYESKQGIPFTISSNAVYALKEAIVNGAWPDKFKKVKKWSTDLRVEFEKMGLTILAEQHCRAPHITTVKLPDSMSSLTVGMMLEAKDILISYRSQYLLEKNYIQVCFMGACEMLSPLLINALKQTLSQLKSRVNSTRYIGPR